MSMPALSIQASIQISASIERVHQTLTDFTTWPQWSPWLYIEPETRLSYTGNPGEPSHSYQWEGKKTGAGSMSLTKLAPMRIDCSLVFLKPFKSQACVWFELDESTPGKTTVSWHMDSKLPFFMFWKKDTFSGMINADYLRGLTLLKDYVEIGKRQSRTLVSGIDDVKASAFVGHQATTSFEQLAHSMHESFNSLLAMERAGDFTHSGNPFSTYHELDFKQRKILYSVCVPVVTSLSVKPPLVSGIRPACRALKAVHTGPYRHLPNAWAMLMSEARDQKLKLSKSVAPFEFYLNELDTTQPHNLITELCLPLR